MLAVARELDGAAPVTLLGLHGQRFGLGLPLSDAARAALPASVAWALAWIDGAVDGAPLSG